MSSSDPDDLFNEEQNSTWLWILVVMLCVVIVSLVVVMQIRQKHRSNEEESRIVPIQVSVESPSIEPQTTVDAQGSEVVGYLSEKEATYLQDAEHLGGFVLGDLAFPRFAKALRDRDREALRELLAEEFAGRLFLEDGNVAERLPFGRFQVLTVDEDETVKQDRESFLDTLLGYREEFAEVEKAALKVITMSPIEHGELDGPWRGSCKLILAGRTLDNGIAKRILKFSCRISSISPETPELGGWLAGLEVLSSEYAYSDRYLMSDITPSTGIRVERLLDNWTDSVGKEKPYLTGGVYLCDYNGDGHSDVLLTDVLDGVSLYRGEGGSQFAEVTEILGPRMDARTVLFADWDNDGDEDLLLDNRLFENVEGQRFRERGPGEFRLPLTPDFAGYAVADYDRDGDLDLYAVGGVYGSGEDAMKWIGKSRVSRNQLFRNLGNLQFEDVTEEAGVFGNGSPAFAACWFDANGDNWPDVMTACYGTNDYFLNQGDGTFRKGKLPAGYGGFSMGISVDDIDNDGLGDPYMGNMYSKAGERVMGNIRPGLYPPKVESLMRDFVTGNDLYQNRGDGTYERIGQSSGINDVGWAYGVGYVDLDSDGLPDVYSPVGFQSVTPNKPDG